MSSVTQPRAPVPECARVQKRPSDAANHEHTVHATLEALLSDTFLQTLPELHGHATEGALFISAQLSMHRRGQRPPKGSGTNMTVEAT